MSGEIVQSVEPRVAGQLVAQSESATLLDVIRRAATDPACDLDKMERLMQMHERVQAKAAEAAFFAELSAMQAELPSVGERGAAAGRYTYALWEDINAAIKPVMQRHGFALTFRTDFAAGVAVTGILTHRLGHSIETTISLPADSSGNKNAVQAVASSVSYGKRYAAGALLNLTSHGEDDDAFAAAEPQYDCTAWTDAIADADNLDTLQSIANDVVAAKIPASALRTIRAAWGARSRAIGGDHAAG